MRNSDESDESNSELSLIATDELNQITAFIDREEGVIESMVESCQGQDEVLMINDLENEPVVDMFPESEEEENIQWPEPQVKRGAPPRRRSRNKNRPRIQWKKKDVG